ncbi:MAG: phospholipase [Actinobacteria bacterium]|nr:phospholipase [Actinomycetota bacterium]
MTRSLASIAVATVTAIGVVAPAPASAAAPTASVSASGGEPSVKEAAIQVRKEEVGGPLYGAYKKLYPTQLNWTNDGCSIPKKVKDVWGLGAIAKKLAEIWQHSCDRHDFGYRNFGSNTTTPGVHHKFSPTEATKHKIDVRFQKNMKLQCNDVNVVFRGPCKKAADVFYLIVRDSKQAHKAFFG